MVINSRLTFPVL